MGQRAADQPEFWCVVKETKRSKDGYPAPSVFGPYTKPEDVLCDPPAQANFDRRSSWRLTVKFRGGYGRNPESGSTSVLFWTGPLSKAHHWLAPILDAKKEAAKA